MWRLIDGVVVFVISAAAFWVIGSVSSLNPDVASWGESGRFLWMVASFGVAVFHALSWGSIYNNDPFTLDWLNFLVSLKPEPKPKPTLDETLAASEALIRKMEDLMKESRKCR